MNKKILNNVLAIGAMVVLSIGIIVGIKFNNGDFSKKEGVALDVSAFSSDIATIEEATLLGTAEEATGYTVTVSTVGFNAAEPVQMKLSFDADKTTVTSMEILSQNETPGLGANVESEGFLGEFNGLAAPVYTADMEAEGSSFDQISGATVTSKAVAAGVNAAFEFLATVQ